MTKEHVLSEIRRVAKQLGHSPGKREFLAATGIREADWSGKHWARWNDALADAGLASNRMQTAYAEESILSSLVALARDLGKFPTVPEMRMARRRDPAFPNDKVFARFGNRNALVSRLKQYCAESGGLADVLAICETHLSRSSEATNRGDELAIVTRGFVYLTKAGRGRYKIGRTNSPFRRHRELSVNIPELTVAVHSIATDDPSGIEAYWHRRFDGKRIAGTEFFKLDATDVRAFKQRKSM